MNPKPIDDQTFAHGTQEIGPLLPKNIPPSFKDPENIWHQSAERAYRVGFGQTPSILPKQGIEVMAALRHLGAIMASPIEDAEKIAALAVLMHAWFDQIFWPELIHPSQVQHQLAA